VPKQLNNRTIENTVLPYTSIRPEQPADIPDSRIIPDTQRVSKSVTSPGFILANVWFCGVIILLFYNLLSFLKLHKKLADAFHITDNLYETKRLSTPFVIGIIKPRIYIPAGLPDYERTYIIRHEQIHIQRKDYLFKLIAFFITGIHWFNPLVWLSFILMGRDMEMSCDEKVIKELGGKIKKQYSASLLSLAADRKPVNGMPLAFGQNNVKNKIKNVLKYKKPAIWVIILSAVTVTSVCIGLFFNPVSTDGSAAGLNYKEKEQPVPLTDYTITENDITLHDGTNAMLKLVMTKGYYYDAEYAGYGGGIYEENYEGDYELQLYDRAGNILSSVSLNADWDYPRINFGVKFDILFADYNQDGCPDFTIGTYGSSNMNLYFLYTVNTENRIIRMVKQPISETKGFSIIFRQESDGKKNRLITQEYNNAAGEYGRSIYEWDTASGYFIRTEGPIYSNETVNEKGPANENATAGENSSGNTVSFPADVTQDSRRETLVTDIGLVREEQMAALSVLNSNGDIIWSSEAHLAHAGWNSLYLCTINGKEYLFRYNPVIYQGHANYAYELFYLDESGTEHPAAGNYIEFSINPGETDYSPEDLAAFADEVNSYLKNSYLLLSTENGKLEYSTPDNKITGTETYSWLDNGNISYENDVLADKLRRYKEEYSG